MILICFIHNSMIIGKLTSCLWMKSLIMILLQKNIFDDIVLPVVDLISALIVCRNMIHVIRKLVNCDSTNYIINSFLSRNWLVSHVDFCTKSDTYINPL